MSKSLLRIGKKFKKNSMLKNLDKTILRAMIQILAIIILMLIEGSNLIIFLLLGSVMVSGLMTELILKTFEFLISVELVPLPIRCLIEIFSTVYTHVLVSWTMTNYWVQSLLRKWNLLSFKWDLGVLQGLMDFHQVSTSKILIFW